MSSTEEKKIRTRKRLALPKAGSRRRRWLFRTAVVILLAAAGAYMVPRLHGYLTHESTDDAYIAGNAVPVATQVRGRVTHLFVTDNQQVTAGEPLLQIDPEDFRLAEQKAAQNLAAAQAQVGRIAAAIREADAAAQQARAELAGARDREDFAVREQGRYQPLVASHLVSQSLFDQVASRRREAKNAARAAGAALAKSLAAVKTLKAEMATQRYVVAAATRGLDQARLDLSRTLVKAPVAGIVAQRNVDAGKYLEAGQPFLSLVETRNVWVEANFKETQMQRLRIGEPVAIEVDAYPGVTFRGHIQSFQPGTGANFSILPPENATGNFVKIVQRVPVKIALDSPFDSVHPLLPGLSVIPEVDVQRGR